MLCSEKGAEMLSDISEIHLRMPEAGMKRVGFSL